MKKEQWWIALVLILLLGFAPLGSTPHLFEKAKWIKGGAVGMQAIDYFDFFLHLSPFIYLFILLGILLRAKYLSKVKNKNI